MLKISPKNRLIIGAAIVICLLLAVVGITYSRDSNQTASQDTGNQALENSDNTLADAEGTIITLNDKGSSIEGSGASIEGDTINITSGGTYTITGSLSEGRIIVNAKDKEVSLILHNADISCSYSSPLYIYKASLVKVILPEGTTSSLEDGTEYTYKDSYSSEADEEPNAVLYSKADLSIEGTGSLIVSGSFNNGITGKDNLTITDAALTVTAVNHGINGKDSNVIKNAALTVTSGGDAIRSTNDTNASLGYITISSSSLKLDAGEDGIQAQTTLKIDGGSYTIKSGGGSETSTSSESSAKAIKAAGDLTISSGSFELDSSDDSIHSNGSIDISGGDFTITSGDDGIHADENLKISNGAITINKSYEGLEGLSVEISGGTIYIKAEDDGINAAGGADSSGFNGFRGSISSSSSDSYIDISGGFITVDAAGDGLDANGSITMTDGTVIVFGPTNNGNGALDYDGNFYLEGGILLAEGSSGMAQVPDNLSQYTISATFNTTISAGTYIELKSNSNTFVFKAEKSMQNLIFSSPDIKEGEEYTLSYGGSYTGGTSENGICTGGTYSGGTELTTLTISSYITTYGNVGMGGSKQNNFIGNPGRQGSNPGEGNPRSRNGRP